MSKPASSVKPAKQPARYEFFGPVGTTFLALFLPVLLHIFPLVCNETYGCPVPALLSPSSLTVGRLIQETGWAGLGSLVSRDAFLFTIGYYVLNAILWAILPATEMKGKLAETGNTQTTKKTEDEYVYRFNSLATITAFFAIVAGGTLKDGADWVVWRFMWDNYAQILTSNIIIAYILATVVYVQSFSIDTTYPDFESKGDKDGRRVSVNGDSGNVLYDWFMGRELNPRVTIPLIGKVDIKSFMELRPGLMLWALLDLTFIARQYQSWGAISNSILVTAGFQIFYVVDSFVMEPAILSTMDITTDGFGVMLSFGDVAWVPFLYSIQARYLAMHPVHLGGIHTAAIVCVGATGYFIFRASNREKHLFRMNPNDVRVSHLTYLETKRGTKLLTSGWWGMSRHMNYFGDWLLAWGFCLPTAFAGFSVSSTGQVEATEASRGWGVGVTYFFVAYFAILLIHRQMRDEELCEKKYGDDWDEYKKIVRWRIVPGVY